MKIEAIKDHVMTKHQVYSYKECGLDDVVLLNGFTVSDNGTLSIVDIHGLHGVIAESRVFSPKRLKGKEIRFLRHYLDWSQKGLGERLGVDYQTILRWETGKRKITKTAERLLRGIVYEYINGDARMIDLIQKIADIDNNRPEQKAEYKHTDEGWAKTG